MAIKPQLKDIIHQELDHCNKCGFCLPACPTYLQTGNELASPRGRLAMAEALANDEIDLGSDIQEAFNLCLGCRACEMACPSGVGYGHVYEATRQALYDQSPKNTLSWNLRPLLHAVKKPSRLRALVSLGRTFRPFLPEKFKTLMRKQPVSRIRAVPHPDTSGKAAYFTGCVSDVIFHDANQAAIDVLQAGGIEVSTPPLQSCCGALHMHAGDIKGAQALAKTNIAAFGNTSDPIVNHAGGCGAFLKEYPQLLADDPEWKNAAHTFAERVEDFTESLTHLPQPLQFVGTGQRVALQNTCHLVNVQRIGSLPKKWIQAVEGDEYVELPGTDSCCGSAGVYNLSQPAMANRLLNEKMIQIQQAQPNILIVNNPGCALQMDKGCQSQTPAVPVQFLSIYLREHLAQAKHS